MTITIQQLCAFYDNVIESKTRPTIVNEQICQVRIRGLDFGCGCYNCTSFIQHHAVWQHSLPMEKKCPIIETSNESSSKTN